MALLFKSAKLVVGGVRSVHSSMIQHFCSQTNYFGQLVKGSQTGAV